MLMAVLFWSSLGLVVFCYLGYPLLLWVWGRWRVRPVRKAEIWPRVSVVLAVRRGREFLRRKLDDLLDLDYPRGLLEFLVVFDGLEDGSPEVAQHYPDPRFRWMVFPEHRGKPTALNAGVAQTTGEILVFTDVRQTLAPDAIRQLAANFNDPEVGAVTGELWLADKPPRKEDRALGLYYRYEQWMRRRESQIYSTVGATGALYALRRELYRPLPAELLLDDMYAPLQAVLGGYRCVFEPEARAYDPRDTRSEFRRKIRTLAGNYQLLKLCPRLLAPQNPVWLQLICHKLARLAVPFALLALLASSAYLAGLFYGTLLALQVAFYAFALVFWRLPRLPRLARLSEIAFAFLVANCAAFVSLFVFLRGRRDVWV